MSELLGALFAVLVGMMVIPKFVLYQQTGSDNTRALITAQQLQTLNAAASTYIQQNATTLQATATATVPAVVTVATLQAPAVNLLPASFSATNPYGQTWQIQVLQPSAGNLQALVMSTGGTAIRDVQASKIGGLVGASGGFIPLNDSTIYAGGSANAFGAFGGWSVATANYTGIAGGHPASLISYTNGQLQSNYLYRNSVPGQPQLNTMNTPLIMAATQTVGTACATVGSIARDATGAVISCQGGTWKQQASASYWKDPVNNYASLPGTDATGTVRTTLDTGRSFMWTGGVWFPMGIDQNGIITVPNAVSAGGGNVYAANVPGEGGYIRLTDVTGQTMYLEMQGGNFRMMNGAWSKQTFWVDQNGNVNAWNDMWARNDVSAFRRLNAGEYVNIAGIGVEGAACAQSGLQGRDAGGGLLSCVNGIWSVQHTSSYYFPVYMSEVNAVCGGGMQWWQESCGRRYCAWKVGPNSFGVITEAGGGFDFNCPECSPPNSYVAINCTK